ncbi:MAG: glycosyltransferase family 1 protein [Chloroflexia bacterium]
MQSKSDGQALRVALDTTFAGTNPTGVGLYSRRLAGHLRVLAEEENLTLLCIGPACRAKTSSGLGATMQEWPIYTQLAVPIFLARNHVEIIHTTSHLGPLVSTARRVVTVHDLLFLRYPNDYNPIWLAITKALLPSVLRRATAIIADSVSTALDIQHFYGTPKRKINVIYPGIDRPSQLHLENENNTTATGRPFDGAPYILCLGPWVGRKNLRVVIAAFERLAERHENVKLVVTGSKPRGMKGEGPEELMSRLPPHIRRRVHLNGHLPSAELQEIIRGASILAYPSRFEGFGLPPLEAMSVGVPVVASDTQVAREVYGDAALYAPSDDPDKWANMLERVLEDTALQQRLKRAGLARSDRFSWERCAKQCVAQYRQVR